MARKAKITEKDGAYLVKQGRQKSQPIISAVEAQVKQFTINNPNPNKLNTPEN